MAMTAPALATCAADLRAAKASWRGHDGRVAMVPTMGALHDGHLSLVAEARRHAPRVIVSIFVNPTQFAPHEDFAAYPRTLASDMEMLAGKADLVFAPAASEIYPDGFATTITMAGPALGLESDHRSHFFAGVATVVARLLLLAMPACAVFGEKDYQQLLVIRRLAEDLALPTRIIGAPTLREADGLALSSRNAYLDGAERHTAARLNRVLKDAIAAARAGAGLRAVEDEAARALIGAGFAKVDYVAIRDSENLAQAETLNRPARILAAAWVGRTRLIDNMAVV